MQDVYKNIEECNVDKKRKMFIIFDDMIAVWLIAKKTKFNSNRIVY